VVCRGPKNYAIRHAAPRSTVHPSPLTTAAAAAVTSHAHTTTAQLDDEGLVYEQEFDSVIKRHLWEYSNSWATTVSPSRRGRPVAAGPCLAELDL
jgi:hypothetical protein